MYDINSENELSWAYYDHPSTIDANQREDNEVLTALETLFTRWAVSRSFAYERTNKYMSEICKNSCLQLKSINNRVTGCQFKRNPDYEDDAIMPESRYEDCMFYMGQPLYRAKDPHIDPLFWCLLLDEARDIEAFTQIRAVSRKIGKFDLTTPATSWILLRLPENDQKRVRVRQVVINPHLSMRESDFVLQVFQK